jgi:hypothetical protein
MVRMSLSVSAGAAASSAWVWLPDDSTIVETSEYTILRPPDYFDYPLAVMQFRPTGPILRRAGFLAFGQEPIYSVPL